MDYELWIRISRVADPVFVDKILGVYRLHADTKTVSLKEKFMIDQVSATRPFWKKKSFLFFLNSELKWRKYASEVGFKDAFKYKCEGNINKSRNLIHESIRIYPVMLLKWHVFNLWIRLLFGDKMIDFVRRKI